MYLYIDLNGSRAEGKDLPFLFTARLVFTFAVDGSEFGQTFCGNPCTFAGNGVVHPFPFFSANDHTGIAKNLHMVGQRRLGNLQFLKHFTGTLFAACQHLQNANTVFIAERFEYMHRFSLVHAFSPIGNDLCIIIFDIAMFVNRFG